MRVGTILNDRYEVLSTIGSGGMSYVYKAKDNFLKRLVAIKVLKSEFSSDASFVAKFRREAEAAGGLTHPNVVSVYDVGEQSGVYYIVMELVEGITLKKYIDRKGKMEEREAVEVALQVAKGIGAAHEQGIIHRDIKPQNIMISREGKIKVTDFGIARISANQTISANTMGSVHYISPEQARGGYCDERSDIYSLGISLYEMVTGRVPFDGESSVAVALQHIQGQMVPPSEYEPNITPNLEKIILKCTQKKPEYRYSSMALLIEDFRKLLTTPDEDFVVMPTITDTGATVIFRKEEADRLRAAAARNVSDDEAREAAALLAAGAAKEKAIKATKPKKKAEPKEPEEETDGGMSQYDEDLAAEARAKKVESRLSYIMLGIGILIIVVLIALFFKACGIIKNPGTDKSTAQPSRMESQSSQATLPVLPTASTKESQESSTAAASTEESTAETSTEAVSTDVKVPDLFGKNYMEAAKMLEKLQLKVEYETEKNGDYEPYSVFRQSYPEGTELPLGTPVMIWVALAADDSVFIPSNIGGMTEDEARWTLQGMGLKVAASTMNKHSDFKRGLVADTWPSMGSVVDVGSTVTLVISEGPPGLALPVKLWGMERKEAGAFLTEAGAENRYIRDGEYQIYSEEYPEGSIAQIVVADTVMEPGDTYYFEDDIYLYTSKGPLAIDPEEYYNDETKGLEADSLKRDLEAAGLTVNLKTSEDTKLPKGRICWFSYGNDEKELTASTRLSAGMIINIYVSSKDKQDDVMVKVPDNLVGKTLKEAERILTSLKFSISYASCSDPEKAVVKSVEHAGEEVEEGSGLSLTWKMPETESTLVRVPDDLEEKTLAEAEQALIALGFGVSYESCEDKEASLVTSVEHAGDSIEKGSIVVITWTIPEPASVKIQLPDVIGQPFGQVYYDLEHAGPDDTGFVVSEEREYHETVPLDHVFKITLYRSEVEPEAWSEWDIGTAVTIYISKGPEENGQTLVQVPDDLEGKTLAEAEQALNALGFNVSYNDCENKEAALVTSVEHAGDSIEEGSTVNLTWTIPEP